MSDNPERKIIVDEDWKEEAQREKETLAKALEEEKKQKARPRLPPASLAVLATSLATQAFMSLGDIPNPLSKEQKVDLEEARFHIDMLEMLEDKTKGNLTTEEAKMFEDVLFDLRMRFVAKQS